MSTDYRQMIEPYDWDALSDLWRAIVAGETPDWEPGKAMEYLVLRALQLDGAEVRWPYTVRIGEDIVEQIDGAIYLAGLACLIECKDQANRVNIEPIAKMRNQLLRRPGTVVGIVFSREGFTAPAVTLAQFTAPQTILLWSGDEVEFALERRMMQRGLVAKYRATVEEGVPDYDIQLEEVR